ncbi:hypothetical protein F4777DRAFT_48176 [Nemania sp. FL0916]|nr:hypothetical protein F4777DRAFT_48176 [Nemania sp. FL0916]
METQETQKSAKPLKHSTHAVSISLLQATVIVQYLVIIQNDIMMTAEDITVMQFSLLLAVYSCHWAYIGEERSTYARS